ncbi:hypothetical protein D3C76_1810050 [compost metagenome]
MSVDGYPKVSLPGSVCSLNTGMVAALSGVAISADNCGMKMISSMAQPKTLVMAMTGSTDLQVELVHLPVPQV